MGVKLLFALLLSTYICYGATVEADQESIQKIELSASAVNTQLVLPLSDATVRGFFVREDITMYLKSEIEEAGYTRIAEFGPGGLSRRFPHANILVDHFASELEGVPADITTYELDIDTEQLPIDDYGFDFVYCRHLMEDINNPIGAFREMTRLSRRGYIETPSPLIESTVIDRVSNGIPGYPHHRFLFWTDAATNTLYAIQKFPTIDILPRTASQIKDWHRILLTYSPMFNNYYQWDVDMGLLPKLVMLKHGMHYNIDNPATYGASIDHGIQMSINHTISFFEKYINPFLESNSHA